MSRPFTILGLHFGHDAAAAVVRDGRVSSYVLRERFSRTKHALGLDLASIDRALRVAGIGPGDLDCVALSSTQGIELILDEPARLDVRYQGSDPFARPWSLAARFGGREHEAIAATGSRTLLDYLYHPARSRTFVGRCYVSERPEHAGRRREEHVVVPWLDEFVDEPAWRAPAGLRELAAVRPARSDLLRYGFHVPVAVTLDRVRLPGYAIHHHLAHAACSYYLSGFDRAAILTHDGFGRLAGYQSGMCCLGDGEAIYPLWPHHLTAGYLYEHAANSLGLGVVGAAGKLMGLAAYGRPRFFDPGFVGNVHDLARRFPDAAQDWLDHCLARAAAVGYDLGAFGDPERATEPVNADVAASTQRLFEVTRSAAVHALERMVGRLGLPVADLCLSGGTALNCPSNSALAAECGFQRVFVEPACDDGGIAIGAALAAHHSILGHPLPAGRPAHPSPYLGHPPSEGETLLALAGAGGRLRIDRCADAAASAADDLAADRIVGWFEGGSEAGPRALGHRSVLADPRRAESWPRVNAAKGRERWRPLAPAVLEEHAADWFGDVPLPSPYMLFNARVRRAGIPAVTHVDGTARIQTVNASCGEYYRVIRRFHELTGVPVVLNTSLNGPGEPIVESPAEAVALFLRQALDVLYVDGLRAVKVADPAPVGGRTWA